MVEWVFTRLKVLAAMDKDGTFRLAGAQPCRSFDARVSELAWHGVRQTRDKRVPPAAACK